MFCVVSSSLKEGEDLMLPDDGSQEVFGAVCAVPVEKDKEPASMCITCSD